MAHRSDDGGAAIHDADPILSNLEFQMHFDEMEAGDFKIYTGAVEAQGRGFKASIVISRVRGVSPPREIYREENMAGGYTWPSATEALRFAMLAGQRLVRTRQPASD